jgi:hypothetical protein
VIRLLSALLKTCFTSHFQSLRKWIETGKDNPFSAIRRLQALAYRECRNYISPPRIQFATRYGPCFTFDGIPLDVRDFARMYHALYNKMKHILYQDLLLGMEHDKIDLTCRNVKRDDLSETMAGYGTLASEREANWAVVEHIMADPVLREQFFYDPGDGRPPEPKREEHLRYGRQAECFKEILFIFIHDVAGMAKRNTEEGKHKIANQGTRMRNFLQMYERLAVLGFRNKTSINDGCDKPTLHFLPPAIDRLVRIFFSLVATYETWIAKIFIQDCTPNYAYYIFSSLGKQWKASKFSKILQNVTKQHLGEGLNTRQLRHILPGIVKHYHIGLQKKPESDAIRDRQAGRAPGSGDRLYARIVDGHPMLTEAFCHDSIDFCTEYHRFWGFGDVFPSLQHALNSLATFEESGGYFVSPGKSDPALEAKVDKALLELGEIKNLLSSLLFQHPISIPGSVNLHLSHPVTPIQPTLPAQAPQLSHPSIVSHSLKSYTPLMASTSAHSSVIRHAPQQGFKAIRDNTISFYPSSPSHEISTAIPNVEAAQQPDSYDSQNVAASGGAGANDERPSTCRCRTFGHHRRASASI